MKVRVYFEIYHRNLEHWEDSITVPYDKDLCYRDLAWKEMIAHHDLHSIYRMDYKREEIVYGQA